MKITVNPTEDPNIRNEHVLAALGPFLPTWMADAFANHPDNVVDYVMNTCYCMGGGPQAGFTMEENGTMLYSGDPPMVPIAMYLPDPEGVEPGKPGQVYKVYQYDYGYVNYVSMDEEGNDQIHMTRMD